MIGNSHMEIDHQKGICPIKYGGANLSKYMHEQEQQVLLLQPDSQILFDIEDECSEEIAISKNFEIKQCSESILYAKADDKQYALNEELPWQKFLRSAVKKPKNIIFQKPIFLHRNGKGSNFAEILRQEFLDDDKLFSSSEDDNGSGCEYKLDNLEKSTINSRNSPKTPSNSIIKKIQLEQDKGEKNTLTYSDSCTNTKEMTFLLHSTEKSSYFNNVLFTSSSTDICSSQTKYLTNNEILKHFLKPTDTLSTHKYLSEQIVPQSSTPFNTTHFTSVKNLTEIKYCDIVNQSNVSYHEDSNLSQKGKDSIIDCDFFNDLNDSFGEIQTSASSSINLSSSIKTINVVEEQLSSAQCSRIIDPTVSVNEDVLFNDIQHFFNENCHKKISAAKFKQSSTHLFVSDCNSKILIQGKNKKLENGLESDRLTCTQKAMEEFHDFYENSCKSVSVSTQSLPMVNSYSVVGSLTSKQHNFNFSSSENITNIISEDGGERNNHRKSLKILNTIDSATLAESFMKMETLIDEKQIDYQQEPKINTTLKPEDEVFFSLLGLGSLDNYETNNELTNMVESTKSSAFLKNDAAFQLHCNCNTFNEIECGQIKEIFTHSGQEVNEENSVPMNNSIRNIANTYEQMQLWHDCTVTEGLGLSQEEVQEFIDLQL